MEYDGLITKPSLDELYHHGVLGQKWGVRNGPPYPLGPDKSTGKALKKSSSGKKTGTAKKTSSNKSSNKQEYGSPLLLSVLSAVALGGVYALANMAINAVANKSIQKVQQVAKKKTFRELTETRENERVDKKTGLRIKSNKDATPEEDLQMTNALRGDKNKTARNTFNNCTYCTTAYDLRRRGFDVVAGSTKQGTTTDDIATWYKNGSFSTATLPKGTLFNTARSRQTVKDQIVQHSGEGSRGNLCVTWSQGYGSGHSMAYEITNGKLVIRDGQSGKTYTDDHKIGPRSVDHILAQVNLNEVQFMRTDNLTPNYELLKKRGIIS